MVRPDDISLNALRVFLQAAQLGSIARAAETLCVTPGAVSHQIKGLEERLGLRLFDRSGNAIRLSAEGRQLLEDAGPGLRILEGALARALRDGEELSVAVSTTLAVRWLIPRLARFRERHPAIKVRVETTASGWAFSGTSADISVVYRPSSQPAPGARLMGDSCLPVYSPALLAQGQPLPAGEFPDWPVVQGTRDNWDWKAWAAQADVDIEELRFQDRFDLDEAAIHAVMGGLGVGLVSAFFITEELRAGLLAALPGFQPVDLGAYHVVQHTAPRLSTRRFVDWLLEEGAVP